MNIKELDTTTLWHLLTDLSEMKVMQSPDKTERFEYWHTIYKQIRNEIDRRMMLDE